MKKICKLIVFIVLFLGCIKVNAEIDFDSLKLEYEKEFDYGTISETNNGISIIFTSNNAEFNGITDKSVIENYGDVYYILNGGAAQKATLFNYNQFFINVDSELAKTNEMSIEIYFLSKDNKKSGSSKFTYLITENGDKEYKDEKTNIKLKINGYKPYGGKFSAQEVTDKNVLDKIKYADPSVYEVFYTSFNNTLNYYSEKYGLTLSISLEIPIPSKYDYNKENFNMYAYIMQKGNIVKSKETSINYSSSNTTYTFPLTGKASDLESYFVFSPSKEWVFDDNQELNEEQPPKEPANTESEKHYCEKVNDKYYGKDGAEVTKEQHEKECLENPDTGFTIPIISLILILSSIFVLKKFKIKNSLKKI